MSVTADNRARGGVLQHPFAKRSLPFLVGCASGMTATVCIQPIDTIKVRLQLMEKGVQQSGWTIAKNIVAEGKVTDLYQGLSAGLLRQLVYGTSRLGLFFTFEKMLEKRASENGTTLGIGGRALASLSAGGLAALIGNPTEVVLIRMQADGMKPVEQRARYKSAFDALWRITGNEGITSLWKGSYPTVIRAMSTNFGQLAVFSESKHQMQKRTSLSSQKRTALAAMIAGFAAAFVSLPFDFVKTRLQNQSMTGKSSHLPMYKGMLDCFVKVIRMEGPLRFYRDFWPYFLRIAPHSTIALVLADRLNMILSTP